MDELKIFFKNVGAKFVQQWVCIWISLQFYSQEIADTQCWCEENTIILFTVIFALQIKLKEKDVL